MQEAGVKKRILYFDLLNIAACICVVAMHCNGIVHVYSDARCWKTSLIVETAAYWAVPVFFMLSGANLINYRKKYSTKEFFIKRFGKTFVPYVIWTVIYFVLKVHYGEIVVDSFNVKQFISMMFNNEIVGIYWFFPVLFTVYFSMPVLSAIDERFRKRIFDYMIIYGIMFISVLPLACRLLGVNFNGDFKPAIVGGYLIYVLIGYQLANTKLTFKVRMVIYVGGVCGWLLRFLTTLLISPKIGEIYKGFWGYLELPTIMLAIAVFVWFQYHGWRKIEANEVWVKIIAKISSCSFGIYLIHWLFIWKIPAVFDINVYGWQWRVLGVMAIYMGALVIVWLIKRIPFIKYLVP